MEAVLLIPAAGRADWATLVTECLRQRSFINTPTCSSFHFAVPLGDEAAVRQVTTLLATQPSVPANDDFAQCRTQFLQGEEVALGMLLLPRQAPGASGNAAAAAGLKELPGAVVVPEHWRPAAATWLAAAARHALHVQAVLPLNNSPAAAAAADGAAQTTLLRPLSWVSSAFPLSGRDSARTDAWVLPRGTGVLLTTTVPLCIDSQYLGVPLHLVAALAAPPGANGESFARSTAAVESAMEASRQLPRLIEQRQLAAEGHTSELVAELTELGSAAGPSAGGARTLSVLLARLFEAPVRHSVPARSPPLAALLKAAANCGRKAAGGRQQQPPQTTEVVLCVSPCVVLAPLRLTHVGTVAGKICVEFVNELRHTAISLDSCTAPCLDHCATSPPPFPVRLEAGASLGVLLGSLAAADRPPDADDGYQTTAGVSPSELLLKFKEEQQQRPARVVLPLNVSWSLVDVDPKPYTVWTRFMTELELPVCSPLDLEFFPCRSTHQSSHGLIYATSTVKLTNRTASAVELLLRLDQNRAVDYSGGALVALQTEYKPPVLKPAGGTVCVDLSFCSSRKGCHAMPDLLIELHALTLRAALGCLMLL